jgi:Fe-S cluster assembly protein SufD
MNKIIKKYEQPGKWEVIIPFEKVGKEREWVGIVDARQPGEYELRVVAEHSAQDTKGRITVRAVSGAGAHVKVYGLIKIHKEAQKTDDFLELRVLTLDRSVRTVAEPTLEIEANEVKASHAASVGQVDKQQVLYLMSRGLTKIAAEGEIVRGFLTK